MEFPAPIHASNVMLLDSKGKATRIRMRIDEDGTKERIGVKSGQVVPRSR